MSAVGFLVALGAAFVAGWFLCSYYEQLGRDEQAAKVRRMVEAAEREGRRA